MFKKSNKAKFSIVLVITCVMLLGAVMPVVQATDLKYVKGFSQGPNYEDVIPTKKVTFVNFDKETNLDDYAYLAAIPTAVFNADGRLFSHPLLFYEDTYDYEEDKERTLNARQGIDYFMEDWMKVCNDKLDQMTLINVPKSKVDQWRANEYISLEGDNPFDIANQIALNDWAYSDEAVVAVINESFEKLDTLTEGTIEGKISRYDMGHKVIKFEQPVIGTAGTYKNFEIEDKNYKYVTAKMTWPNRIDLDLQLYDTKLGMVDNAMETYSAPDPNLEVVGSFIHNYGKWELSVTAVPKKSLTSLEEEASSIGDSIKELVQSLSKTGNIDICFYPGIIVNLEQTPFGCRNAKFKLNWDNPNVRLGFTLLDPDGTEICSSLSKHEIATGIVESKETEVEVDVNMLGECEEGEKYSVCVFVLGDTGNDVDFEFEYSWEQVYSEFEADCFVSATNGAVLASSLNAPLLYTTKSKLPDATKDALYSLGVNEVYLVDIGGYLSEDVKNELENLGKFGGIYEEPKEIYDAIIDTTGNCDIIFTTIDPWTYFYVAELEPAGEYESALFVGPAAYIAAHHGSPVLIIDEHSKLSQAATYPTHFWRTNSAIRHTIVPSAAGMILSGRNVYKFLEEYELGELEEGLAVSQDQETIITVAGQYDIGTPWDRMFTGAALPGRFWGSPVDTAYAISRNMFYPALIYANPAVYEEEATRINGSTSSVQKIGGRLKYPKGITLVVNEQNAGEQEYRYPVLQTFNTYAYKFNEIAYKQWDFRYERADKIIPFITHSDDPIDDGITGKPGAYYPDLSETDVLPFYAVKAGYDPVFSTEATAVVENLNRGVIIWTLKGHGYQKNSGQISMWDPNHPYANEQNPWRVYEPVTLAPRNLREFVRWLIYVAQGEKPSAITDGLIDFHLLSDIGSTENPDVATLNPQNVFLNNLRKAIGLPMDLWGPFGVRLHRDRLKHPLETIKEGLPFVNWYDGDGKVVTSGVSGHMPMGAVTGLEFDDMLENIHSCGLNTGACLPACTYIHMTWMRHGMVYQIIDPWTTTDWNGIWNQMLLKRTAMGDTIGEAYERGMRACAQELLVGQFWWDVWENVEFFGDPELRIFVPNTEEWDPEAKNYWEKPDTLSYDAQIELDGHMLFGATSHPNAREPQTFIQENLFVLSILAIVVILSIVVAAIGRRRKK